MRSLWRWFSDTGVTAYVALAGMAWAVLTAWYAWSGTAALLTFGLIVGGFEVYEQVRRSTRR